MHAALYIIHAFILSHYFRYTKTEKAESPTNEYDHEFV